jgi:hypothetical protein
MFIINTYLDMLVEYVPEYAVLIRELKWTFNLHYEGDVPKMLSLISTIEIEMKGDMDNFINTVLYNRINQMTVMGGDYSTASEKFREMLEGRKDEYLSRIEELEELQSLTGQMSNDVYLEEIGYVELVSECADLERSIDEEITEGGYKELRKLWRNKEHDMIKK